MSLDALLIIAALDFALTGYIAAIDVDKAFQAGKPCTIAMLFCAGFLYLSYTAASMIGKAAA